MKYDVMNDLMSLGMHRLWKKFTIAQANVRPGQKVLDIAGGTGDLAAAFAKATQWGEHPDAEVWLSDINASMLGVGRDRLLDRGLALPAIQFDAEKIPFPNNYFDVVSVAFGLRNMTHKDAALGEMARVIKAGGKVLVLEFSKPDAMIAPIYDIYSFKVLPWLGDKVAKDAASYQYLAESIRMHPDADALKTMMLGVGFDQVDTHRMTGGIVALHSGVKY
jgi:demethylmenaquinone methyltransferase/2-methoxy-6-polyprenyl-1,4-benzoquinol methylase